MSITPKAKARWLWWIQRLPNRMKKIHPVFVMVAPFMVLVSCTQAGANGYEQRVHVEQTSHPVATDVAVGRTLFLRNCAHCHGADAHGDEGPDLHDLDWTDQQIATRIRNGKAGLMTAFNGKLQPSEIDSLIAYVRSLK
jgi:mono/diheme cytochrome c family protein